MPSFGGWEILVVVLAALIILGPSKLPEIARTLALWMGRIRRVFNNFKLELEREVGMDEIRQQLHNEQIMAEMKSLETETRSILTEADNAVQATSSKQSDTNNDTLQSTKSNPHWMKSSTDRKAKRERNMTILSTKTNNHFLPT